MTALLVLLGIALALTVAYAGGMFGTRGGVRRRTTVVRPARRRVVREEVVEREVVVERDRLV